MFPRGPAVKNMFNFIQLSISYAYLDKESSSSYPHSFFKKTVPINILEDGVLRNSHLGKANIFL
jgi:hypothetical protein